jgi:hypothetical protein
MWVSWPVLLELLLITLRQQPARQQPVRARVLLVPFQPERLAHCSLPVLAAFHRKLKAEVPLLNQLEERGPLR